MTTRKLNRAQEIALLKNEVERTRIFTDKAAREAEALDELAKVRTLTKDERKRVNELIDFIHDSNVFLVNATKAIHDFYKPATI